MRRQYALAISLFAIVIAGTLLGGQADLDEPFGIATAVAPEGPLWVEWRRLQSEIRSDEIVIAQCRAEPDSCGSPAALRFLAIVEAAKEYAGLPRIGHINRAVNLALRPSVGDADSVWKSPLAALASATGNCASYAITKYAALGDAGIAADDLHLVTVRIKSRRELHMVVTVRDFGRWIVLDNRSMALLESNGIDDYLPMFTLDHRGVRQFVPPASLIPPASPKVTATPCSQIAGGYSGPS
jgi:predicted transglutaminase-like cysteine proteinase